MPQVKRRPIDNLLDDANRRLVRIIAAEKAILAEISDLLRDPRVFKEKNRQSLCYFSDCYHVRSIHGHMANCEKLSAIEERLEYITSEDLRCSDGGEGD